MQPQGVTAPPDDAPGVESAPSRPGRAEMRPKLRLALACAALTPPLVIVAAWAFGQGQTDWRYKVAGLGDPFLGRPAPELTVIIGLVLTVIIAAATAATGLVRWTRHAATDLAGRLLGWSWLLLLIAWWGGYAAGGATIVAAGGPIDYRATIHWEFGAPFNHTADVSGTCRSVVGRPETVAEVRADVAGLPPIYLRNVVSGDRLPLLGSTPWEDAGDYPEGAAIFEPTKALERPSPYLEAAGVARRPISFVRAYEYQATDLADSRLSGTAHLTGTRFGDPYGGGSLRWVNLTVPNDPWPPTLELSVSWTCGASTD